MSTRKHPDSTASTAIPAAENHPVAAAVNVLSETLKAQIIAEERFRQEVRSSLAGVREPSKALSFLNSPFGLFLLSSIVLALVTSQYAVWTEKAKEANDRAKYQRYLHQELDRRGTMIELALSEQKLSLRDAQRIAGYLQGAKDAGSTEHQRKSVIALLVDAEAPKLVESRNAQAALHRIDMLLEVRGMVDPDAPMKHEGDLRAALAALLSTMKRVAG